MLAYIWSIVSGVLLALPFKFPEFALVSWIGLIPFLMGQRNKSSKQSFLLGWIMGIVFLAVSSYWLVYPVVKFSGYSKLISGLLVSLALVVLALYFGVFSFLVTIISDYLTYPLFITVPFVWTGIEIIRTFFSFQFLFGFLGYSQSYTPQLIQLAEYGGVYLISFIIVLINTLLYRAFIVQKQKTKLTYLLTSVVIFSLIFGYGQWKINHQPNRSLNQIKVGVVQPSISQQIKLNPSYETYIANKLQELSNQVISHNNLDLLVWPETAILRTYNLNSKFPYQLNKKVPMLVGGLTRRSGNVFNSALLVDQTRDIVSNYSKNKLVPWGEYVPFPKLVPDFIETNLNHLTPGKKLKDFTFHDIDFIIPICSEILNPFYLRKLYSQDELIINISNEAWFNESNAPLQILQAAIFRAVETRTPVVKVGNTGISGVINSYGEVLIKTDLFVETTFSFPVQLSKNQTGWYAKNGPLFSLIVLGGMFYLVINSWRKAKTE